MSTSTPTVIERAAGATLESDRRSMLRAQDVLADLEPRDFGGLASPLATDSLSVAVRKAFPLLCVPCRLSGRLGMDSPPADDLFVPMPALKAQLAARDLAAPLKPGTLLRFEAQPRFVCWPQVIPALEGGAALTDYPTMNLVVGDILYIRATWTVTDATLGIAAAQLFFDANPDLELGNDLSAIPAGAQTVRTWTFALGNVSTAGVFALNAQGANYFPWIPPPLQRAN